MAVTQPKKTTKKAKVEVDMAKKPTGLGAKLGNAKKRKSSIHKDVQVEVMNNVSGKLFYRCPKTNTVIEMLNYGDTEILTMEQLNAMKNSHRAMLNNFWIVLVDVLDDEVTLDDVLKELRIDKIYDGIEFDSEILENAITSTSLEEFKDIIVEMNPQLVVRVAERIKLLSMGGQFGDMYKMNFIADLMEQPDLFQMDERR